MCDFIHFVYYQVAESTIIAYIKAASAKYRLLSNNEVKKTTFSP